MFDRAVGLIAMVGAEHHSHSLIPCQSFEAEDWSVRRKAGDGSGPLLPARVQIVVPEIGDVAFHSVHFCSQLFHFGGECAARGIALVEDDLVKLHGSRLRSCGNRRSDACAHRYGQGESSYAHVKKFSSIRHRISPVWAKRYTSQ